MTCFNRRETTLTCLANLWAQQLPKELSVDVYLTDDGCTDGTPDAVCARFPDTRIIVGDGTLFWNGGMRLALREAMRHEYDFYLWLNDDTTLDPDAITRLVGVFDAVSESSKCAAIVVGTPADPDGGKPLYGGRVRASRLKPMRFSRVAPGDEPVRCDTFDGNCVLVSATAVRKLGNLDPAFAHLMGDTDYGLRAGQAGIPIWVAPGTIGNCAGNPDSERHRNPDLSFVQRVTWIIGIKGLRPREWKVITRRHAGPLWFLFWLSPYFRFAAEAMSASVCRSRRRR